MTTKELLIHELETEARATRECLERVPAALYDYKPHEKSMLMGYLALVTAEIPRWISSAVEEGTINFGTFKHADAKAGPEFVKEFDANLEGARKALAAVSEDELANGRFELKRGDQVLMSGTKLDTASSSIRHMVHHRGQLTVYLRLNDIAVPSIYGPSADDRRF
ncbi:MAG TPA: DinB family protein [Candidatus Paceibacterota bacterium]|nr:DinB family protein [Candidatus Paceibacterota bacterium]